MITNPASQAKYSFDGRQVDVDLKMCERLLRFYQYYDCKQSTNIIISSNGPWLDVDRDRPKHMDAHCRTHALWVSTTYD